MKTTMKAKVVIDTDNFRLFGDDTVTLPTLTMVKIKEEIVKGHYLLEWINCDYSNIQEPTLVIKL